VANRLASEQSPYLLQHKDNPVDWRPWGTEAFDAARGENKPIFLSIGYSTCHWCHVMEHESFENREIAEVLNRHFVSIKVDREERPDVDRVYMTFVQVTTGSGGWPMSVWLTPSLQPFYGGTYFPPSSKWGKPGFVDVLEEIARVWREERDKVEQSAATIIERLRGLRSQGGRGPIPSPDALDRAAEEFAVAFDRRRGGFGQAPKFPRPSELLFLLREHARTDAAEPRDMVLVTLRAMALGGMRDHIGGGFHRYSVDAEWRVPHFEKMLYDQAQLVLAYVEAAQVTGDSFFADVAIDTLAYYAGWCDKINGQVVPARPDALTYTVREPVGVVAAIVPWNFPLMIGMWKIAPALACGCTLIVKPAEITPLSALMIGRLALEAGVPPGVLNIVTGKGSVVGDALVAHPGIDKVTFTGSPSVGRGILQGAAGNFKRVTLELGGKSANIVFDDADLDQAVNGVVSGIFAATGQTCIAGSRALIHRPVYDEFVDRLLALARSARMGNPLEPATQVGPT